MISIMVTLHDRLSAVFRSIECLFDSLSKLATKRSSKSLQWRHNEHGGVPNHQRRDCLLSRLFRRKSRKTSKLRVTGLCEGNSPATGEFPHKGPVTRKTFPFEDIIMALHYMPLMRRMYRSPMVTQKKNIWDAERKHIMTSLWHMVLFCGALLWLHNMSVVLKKHLAIFVWIASLAMKISLDCPRGNE